MKQSQAFTLLELLLAISLMVLLSTFIFTWLKQSAAQIHTVQQQLRDERSIFQAVSILRQDILLASHKQRTAQLNDAQELKLLSHHQSSNMDSGLQTINYFVDQARLFRRVNAEAPRFVCQAHALGLDTVESETDSETSYLILWWQHSTDSERRSLRLDYQP